MLRVLCLFLLATYVVDKAAGDAPIRGQFNGGTFSFSVRNDSSGRLVTDLDLITGWVLEQGPCGTGCGKSNIDKSTLVSRQKTLANVSDPLYFGNWTAEFKANGMTQTKGLNTEIASSMKEVVLAMNKMAKWEQEWMQVSVPLEPTNTDLYEDIYFEGEYWHNMTMQGTTQKPWHIQAKIDKRIRSDTGKPNQSPKVLMKPFYRTKLDTIGKIRITATDPDGDHVKCKIAEAVEGGEIIKHTLPGLTVHDNCTVIIDASTTKYGYHDDAWGAVALTVTDYNKEPITMGVEHLNPYAVTLSKTAVQFLIQVLAVLNVPVFVQPTAEPNHHFILYAGTVWSQKLFAKASENTTIFEFIVLGRQQEKLVVSSIQDASETRVRYIEITWEPKPSEIGHHIICTTAIDDTGVDSAEDRCFTIEIRPDRFNHSSNPSTTRPYFIDLPAFEQTVHCLKDVTCVLPLYIKSTEAIDTIKASQSYFKTTAFGPISKVTHNGVDVYKSDLSFRDSVDGTKKICLIAHDIKGIDSEETCIQSKLVPPDPCAQVPCVNAGVCKRSDIDPLAYACHCMSESFTGKNCEIHKLKCDPDPCGPGKCYPQPPDGMFCYCSGTGYSGERCSVKEDKCKPDPCNGHGVCVTTNGVAECKCYDRYLGQNCSTDNCTGSPQGQLTCYAQCANDPCHGNGVCVSGGQCVCSVGYKTNPTCDTASGNASYALNVLGTKFVPPTPEKASTIQCYLGAGGTNVPCVFSVFVATSESGTPTINIDRVSREIKASTVGVVSEVQYIHGLDKLYTADVNVKGVVPGTFHMCLKTAVGYTSGRLCVQISYVQNPLDVPESVESHQKNAIYKFISPSPNAESNLVCRVNTECRLILHTNLNTQCEKVITADKEVTAFPPIQQSSSCVSEVSYTFKTDGSKHICFSSSVKPNSQTRCFNIGVFSRSDCDAEPCKNDGDCFLSNRTSFYCVCKDGYEGDHCEKGECTKADNHCDSSAFCFTDGHASHCICPMGMTGSLCRDNPDETAPAGAVSSGSALFIETGASVSGTKFTDTAIPVKATCVVHRLCTIPIGVTTNTQGTDPVFSFGFVSPHVRTAGIATEPSITRSFKASVSVIPLEVGLKKVCVQTHVNSVNDDEMCIMIEVTKDAASLYGFHERPHFILPSLPPNAEVKCPGGESCHVLYHVTHGDGHVKECTNVYFSKSPFEHGYVFSSCSNCVSGYGSNNCSIDVSFIPPIAAIGDTHHVCLGVEITDTHLKGEERCFNVTVDSKANLDVKTGCQKKQCKHGAFCDAHVDPPVCYCTSGYTGPTCDTKISGSTTPTKGSFINNFAVPTSLSCHVNTPCPISVHLNGPHNPAPKLSLGYTSPGLYVNKKPVTKHENGTDYIGETSVTPTHNGTHKVCVQTETSGTVDDEVCVTIHVGDGPAPKVDTTKPYFIEPTPVAHSTFVCKTSVTCYIEVFFYTADKFHHGDRGCPSVEDTSPTYNEGVHIFEPEKRLHSHSDCKNSIAYLPPIAAKDQQKTICTQVVLPGKQGEERCFNILVKDNVVNAVTSPCKGRTCQHNGKCVADLTSSSPSPKCLCPKGYDGPNCQTDVSSPTELPGTKNTSSTNTTPHFDGTSAIPKEIACVKDKPCQIPFVYHGTNPPVIGYVDPLLTHGKPKVLPTGNAVTEVTASTIGTHKICLQTTATGAPNSENVDEVCVDVKISSGPSAPVNKTNPYFSGETIPDNSIVSCNLDRNCHVPVYTKSTNGKCPQVSECPPGLKGVHVFEPKLLNNGICDTDTVYKTGSSATNESLCISAGPDGEERHVTIEVKAPIGFGPCQRTHCKHGGKCVADFTNTNPTAACVCPKGFEGTNCEKRISLCSHCCGEHWLHNQLVNSADPDETAPAGAVSSGSSLFTDITTTNTLPGVTPSAITTQVTQHFDGTGAIPTKIVCVKGEVCKIPIPFQGSNPPKIGYVDPLIKAGTPKLIPGGNAITEITTNSTGGPHKVCVQTTANGVNVDEICVDVTVKAGPSNQPNQNKPHFGGETVPDNSTVACNINTNCRIPVYTEPGTNHRCSPVKECPPGTPGMHVFETKLDHGTCYTEAVVKTGATPVQNTICISSGLGGEKRHVVVDVKQFTEFGPCQKRHCENGATCLADNGGTSAKCLCPKLVSGPTCNVVSPCKGKVCGHGQCVEKQSGSTTTIAVCACETGFQGSGCTTKSNPSSPLPGIKNGTTPSAKTPNFDGQSAIPTKIVCEANKACQIPIQFHGLSSNPPILGHFDTTLHATKPTSVGGPGGSTPGQHTVVTTVSPTSPGTHKLCLQTTDDGTDKGVNLDEICVDVEVKPSGTLPSPNQSKPHFENPMISTGSEVTCNKDSSCHVPIVTAKPINGNCSAVSLCTPRIDAAHVFEAKLEHGQCVTDVVIKTGSTAKSDSLCISSGPGGETRTITVKTKEFKEFGPCQRLHCKNGGKCDSSSGTATCLCPNLIRGTSCETVSPCRGKTCHNGGDCVEQANGGAPVAVCACPKGFEGSDCNTHTSTPTTLIGVHGSPTPTQITPRFDGSTAVPKEIVCFQNQPCPIAVPYHGVTTKPPILGHVDTGVTAGPLVITGGPNPGPHTAVTNVTTSTPGSHKVCLQTTLDGAAKGENIDEICVSVNVKTGPIPAATPTTTPHFTGSHLPDGSTVTCNLQTNCHIPVTTEQTGGTCSSVKDCTSPKIQNVRVFATKPDNGQCVTDVVVRTGSTTTTDLLCLSAGSGGEERHVNVETKNVTGFGPCQKVHCKNGGSCDAKSSGAVCVCPANSPGPTCNGVISSTVSSISASSSDIPTPTSGIPGPISTNTFVQNLNSTHLQNSDTCDVKAESIHARKMVKSGRVRCWCTVKGKRVDIINRNPSPTTKQQAMAAAYGAGGMTGAMAAGVAIYIIVNKLKQPKVHPRQIR